MMLYSNKKITWDFEEYESTLSEENDEDSSSRPHDDLQVAGTGNSGGYEIVG